MVAINAPFPPFSAAALAAKQYALFPPVCFGSSSLLKLFAFYLCHANQDSHSSMNRCVQKKGQVLLILG